MEIFKDEFYVNREARNGVGLMNTFMRDLKRVIWLRVPRDQARTYIILAFCYLMGLRAISAHIESLFIHIALRLPVLMILSLLNASWVIKLNPEDYSTLSQKICFYFLGILAVCVAFGLALLLFSFLFGNPEHFLN